MVIEYDTSTLYANASLQSLFLIDKLKTSLKNVTGKLAKLLCNIFSDLDKQNLASKEKIKQIIKFYESNLNTQNSLEFTKQILLILIQEENNNYSFCSKII